MITARRTPCRTQEIAISHETYGPTEETWVAECRGRRYACSTREVDRRLKHRCRLREPDASPELAATTDAGVAPDADTHADSLREPARHADAGVP
jgi:hypothetical protein